MVGKGHLLKWVSHMPEFILPAASAEFFINMKNTDGHLSTQVNLFHQHRRRFESHDIDVDQCLLELYNLSTKPGKFTSLTDADVEEYLPTITQGGIGFHGGMQRTTLKPAEKVLFDILVQTTYLLAGSRSDMTRNKLRPVMANATDVQVNWFEYIKRQLDLESKKILRSNGSMSCDKKIWFGTKASSLIMHSAWEEEVDWGVMDGEPFTDADLLFGDLKKLRSFLGSVYIPRAKNSPTVPKKQKKRKQPHPTDLDSTEETTQEEAPVSKKSKAKLGEALAKEIVLTATGSHLESKAVAKAATKMVVKQRRRKLVLEDEDEQVDVDELALARVVKGFSQAMASKEPLEEVHSVDFTTEPPKEPEIISVHPFPQKQPLSPQKPPTPTHSASPVPSGEQSLPEASASEARLEIILSDPTVNPTEPIPIPSPSGSSSDSSEPDVAQLSPETQSRKDVEFRLHSVFLDGFVAALHRFPELEFSPSALARVSNLMFYYNTSLGDYFVQEDVYKLRGFKALQLEEAQLKEEFGFVSKHQLVQELDQIIARFVAANRGKKTELSDEELQLHEKYLEEVAWVTPRVEDSQPKQLEEENETLKSADDGSKLVIPEASKLRRLNPALLKVFRLKTFNLFRCRCRLCLKSSRLLLLQPPPLKSNKI